MQLEISTNYMGPESKTSLPVKLISLQVIFNPAIKWGWIAFLKWAPHLAFFAISYISSPLWKYSVCLLGHIQVNGTPGPTPTDCVVRIFELHIVCSQANIQSVTFYSFPHSVFLNYLQKSLNLHVNSLFNVENHSWVTE